MNGCIHIITATNWFDELVDLQDECRGNPTELSLLFMHAQDTVMTIISEVSMIRLMIQMNRNLEDKINGNRN